LEDILIDFEEMVSIQPPRSIAPDFQPAKARKRLAWLVEADSRGIRSHGVVRLTRYLNEAKQGFINPEADPEVVFETPVSLVVDGNRGLGQRVSTFAMERCIEKAEASYICFAAVRNSNHFGIAGYYSEMAQKKGMIGITMTNTYPLVVPHSEGKPARTNPSPSAPRHEGALPYGYGHDVVPRGKIEVKLRADSRYPRDGRRRVRLSYHGRRSRHT